MEFVIDEVAVKKDVKLNLLLYAPFKAGKTYTALKWGTMLAKSAGGPLAVIDTEFKSAALYADEFNFIHLKFGIDPKDPNKILPNVFSPQNYKDAIKELIRRYKPGCIIVDSLTPAYTSEGGLQQINRENQRGNDTFGAWGKGTPIWEDLCHFFRVCGVHLIATARSKTQWEREPGTLRPIAVGMGADLRPGTEHHFDIIATMSQDHTLYVDYTRCRGLEHKVYPNPGTEAVEIMLDWLKGEGPGEWLDIKALPPMPAEVMKCLVELRAAFPTAAQKYGENWEEGLLRGILQLKPEDAWPNLHDPALIGQVLAYHKGKMSQHAAVRTSR